MMEAQALVVHLVETFEYAPDPNTKNDVVVSETTILRQVGNGAQISL